MVGEIENAGILKESRIQLDQSYNKVTGIDMKIFYVDGAGAATEENHGIIISLSDRKKVIFDSIFANNLKHTTDLPSDERFFPVDLDSKSNELTFSYRTGVAGWKADQTVKIYIALRYE